MSEWRTGRYHKNFAQWKVVIHLGIDMSVARAEAIPKSQEFQIFLVFYLYITQNIIFKW